MLIASPLGGSGWVNLNGCCADPTSRHRNAVLSANGTYVTPDMFDIDWAQVINGSLFRGDGKQLSDYPDFGAPIYAVANGAVVSTITDRPEVAPFAPKGSNPTVKTPKDFSGNELIERIGPGVYAAYEHLQPTRWWSDQAIMSARGNRSQGSVTPATPQIHTFTSASTTDRIS